MHDFEYCGDLFSTLICIKQVIVKFCLKHDTSMTRIKKQNNIIISIVYCNCNVTF